MGEGPQNAHRILQRLQMVALHQVHPVKRANLSVRVVPE